MEQADTRIIHRDDLPLGGFAGIVETRMVKNPVLWADAQNDNTVSHGLGDFVYLATGYFKANDGAPLHPHADVDIVSFIPNGAVGHEGTMGHGTAIHGPGVQVQRAGTGIQHSEFSLNGEKADLVQIWFLPPKRGLKPGYKDFKLHEGPLTTVLGGNDPDTFNNAMTCQIGLIAKAGTVSCNAPFVAFVSNGTAIANGLPVKSGDIIEGQSLNLSTETGCGLVLIQFTEAFQN